MIVGLAAQVFAGLVYEDGCWVLAFWVQLSSFGFQFFVLECQTELCCETNSLSWIFS